MKIIQSISYSSMLVKAEWFLSLGRTQEAFKVFEMDDNLTDKKYSQYGDELLRFSHKNQEFIQSKIAKQLENKIKHQMIDQEQTQLKNTKF